MKTGILVLFASILLSTNSFAVEPIACNNISKVIDCINSDEDRQNEPGRWGEVKATKLSAGRSLILVEDKYASNVNTTLFWVFLYTGNAKILYNITPSESLALPDIDAKHRVILSFNKRGQGDVGNIVFYKLDVNNIKLSAVKRFATDSDDGVKYLDENNNPDKAGGFIERAGEYAKKMKYNLPSIQGL